MFNWLKNLFIREKIKIVYVEQKTNIDKDLDIILKSSFSDDTKIDMIKLLFQGEDLKKSTRELFTKQEVKK